FDWVTSPFEPGLRTRIEAAVFDGSICLASEAASAAWSVSADWSDDWIPGSLEPPQPQDEPDWVWSLSCEVSASLLASALEAAVFDCVTSPFEPGLSTRIDVFVLLGSTCFAAERAAAS